MFMATGFCSSKDWVFLGLSMANWSSSLLPCFLAAAGVAAGRGHDAAQPPGKAV
jgi:disulfide bond formation protein DsbB